MLLLATVTPQSALAQAGQKASFNNNYSINDSNYDDLLGSETQLRSVGIANKPTYNTDSLGYQMIATDTTEVLGVTYQFSHGVNVGTKWNPHIHWIQSYAAENPRFVISYSISKIGGLYNTPTSYMLCNNKEIAYTSGKMHQISECNWVAGTNVDISSLIDLKLRCTLGGNMPPYVILKSIDIHYRRNSDGSQYHNAK